MSESKFVPNEVLNRLEEEGKLVVVTKNKDGSPYDVSKRQQVNGRDWQKVGYRTRDSQIPMSHFHKYGFNTPGEVSFPPGDKIVARRKAFAAYVPTEDQLAREYYIKKGSLTAQDLVDLINEDPERFKEGSYNSWAEIEGSQIKIHAEDNMMKAWVSRGYPNALGTVLQQNKRKRIWIEEVEQGVDFNRESTYQREIDAFLKGETRNSYLLPQHPLIVQKVAALKADLQQEIEKEAIRVNCFGSPICRTTEALSKKHQALDDYAAELKALSKSFNEASWKMQNSVKDLGIEVSSSTALELTGKEDVPSFIKNLLQIQALSVFKEGQFSIFAPKGKEVAGFFSPELLGDDTQYQQIMQQVQGLLPEGASVVLENSKNGKRLKIRDYPLEYSRQLVPQLPGDEVFSSLFAMADTLLTQKHQQSDILFGKRENNKTGYMTFSAQPDFQVREGSLTAEEFSYLTDQFAGTLFPEEVVKVVIDEESKTITVPSTQAEKWHAEKLSKIIQGNWQVEVLPVKVFAPMKKDSPYYDLVTNYTKRHQHPEQEKQRDKIIASYNGFLDQVSIANYTEHALPYYVIPDAKMQGVEQAVQLIEKNIGQYKKAVKEREEFRKELREALSGTRVYVAEELKDDFGEICLTDFERIEDPEFPQMVENALYIINTLQDRFVDKVNHAQIKDNKLVVTIGDNQASKTQMKDYQRAILPLLVQKTGCERPRVEEKSITVYVERRNSAGKKGYDTESLGTKLELTFNFPEIELTGKKASDAPGRQQILTKLREIALASPETWNLAKENLEQAKARLDIQDHAPHMNPEALFAQAKQQADKLESAFPEGVLGNEVDDYENKDWSHQRRTLEYMALVGELVKPERFTFSTDDGGTITTPVKQEDADNIINVLKLHEPGFDFDDAHRKEGVQYRVEEQAGQSILVINNLPIHKSFKSEYRGMQEDLTILWGDGVEIPEGYETLGQGSKTLPDADGLPNRVYALIRQGSELEWDYEYELEQLAKQFNEPIAKEEIITKQQQKAKPSSKAPTEVKAETGKRVPLTEKDLEGLFGGGL